MSVSERIRRLSRLVPFPALILAAACGGGDNKSPTGPTDPGPGQQGGLGFELVSLGRAGLPADAAVEDCTLTRFYGGDIQIDPDTGEWELTLRVHDQNLGDWRYKDGGESVGNGTTVLFESDVTGITHEATVNGDATEIKMMYDWCEDGVGDVQLVFDR